jgi:hypothetical protein
MDDDDQSEWFLPALRRSYARLAAWMTRTNRFPEPSRLPEPSRIETLGRIMEPSRQLQPPRPWRPRPVGCRLATSKRDPYPAGVPVGERPDMYMYRRMTSREIARTIAGAVTSPVIVGWLVFFAIAPSSARWSATRSGWMNRHRFPESCWRTIFSEKPLHAFPDHAREAGASTVRKQKATLAGAASKPTVSSHR